MNTKFFRIVLTLVLVTLAVLPAAAQDDDAVVCSILIDDKVVEVPENTLDPQTGKTCLEGQWVIEGATTSPVQDATNQAVEPNTDSNDTCEASEINFNEQRTQDGSLLFNRIDVSFATPFLLDYYEQPGQPAFVIVGRGGEQRFVMSGFGKLFKYDEDCGGLDLAEEARIYSERRLAFGVDQSGLGWTVEGFLNRQAPLVNVLNTTSSPPFRLLEVGNNPVDEELQRNAIGAIPFTANATSQTTTGSTCTIYLGNANVRPAPNTQGNPINVENRTAAMTVQGAVNGENALGTTKWFVLPMGYVNVNAVTVVGSCSLLDESPSAMVAPATNSATAPVNAPQTSNQNNGYIGRDGDADGRIYGPGAAIDTASRAYLCNACWEGPGLSQESVVVIPVGESISGLKGGNWVYGSTAAALADAATKGKPVYVVTNGVLVAQ